MPALFVNLPVRDLPRSVTFFSDLGFHFHPGFTDANASAMAVGTEAFVMLLAEPYFSHTTGLPVCDTSTANEAVLCLSAVSRTEVDDLHARAVRAGGKSRGTVEEAGLYGAAFLDPDGHRWEVLYLDPAFTG
jgi:uncharacterized protein